MNAPARPTPPDPDGITPAPDLGADDVVATLLHAAPGDAWAPAAGAAALHRRLADRLAARVADSARLDAGMVTVRQRQRRRTVPVPGVEQELLYLAPGDSLRPGEPSRVVLLHLAPGQAWQVPVAAEGLQRDWLVLHGEVAFDGEALAPFDYRVEPAGHVVTRLRAGSHGARLYLREAPLPTGAGERARTVREADAPWQDYAPRIRRRVLWRRGDEAALLYRTEPEASVPLHRHGHDEECLMVRGDLFIDDLLLREGDYQIAPAGSAHQRLHTDTGVILYAHGDADLDFV